MDYINKIFCCNCLDLMKEMISNNFQVDAIITDPPYGVGIEYDNYDDTFENWMNLISEFIPLALKISKSVVIFPSGRLKGEKFIYKEFGDLLLWRICWHKGPMPSRAAIGWTDWEMLFVFGKNKNFAVHDYFSVHPRFNIYTEGLPDIMTEHPCIKRMGFFDWLITHFSEQGNIIFDPFCGSGMGLGSAKKLGRKYIGCDISQKYVNISNKVVETIEEKIQQKMKQIKVF